jgi:hypothetical protein
MFQALLAHPQDVLHKRHLVYYMHMSVGCATTAVKLQSWQMCEHTSHYKYSTFFLVMKDCH